MHMSKTHASPNADNCRRGGQDLKPPYLSEVICGQPVNYVIKGEVFKRMTNS